MSKLKAGDLCVCQECYTRHGGYTCGVRITGFDLTAEAKDWSDDILLEVLRDLTQGKDEEQRGLTCRSSSEHLTREEPWRCLHWLL